jgi:hypothetical protein
VLDGCTTGLDLVLQLSTPKYSSSHADLLHSLVSRCKSLQKTLETVAARVQRLQVSTACKPSMLMRRCTRDELAAVAS